MKDKNQIIALVVILSILALVVTLIMFGMLFGNIGFMRFRNIRKIKISNELVLNKEYDNNFQRIEIQSDASDIYLKESNNDKVNVIVYSDKETTTIDASSNKLLVKTKAKKCFLFCVSVKASKIEIYLPKDYQNIIEITNKYGDIKIASFKNSNIKIKASCGDVTVAQANNISIDSDYGDVDIKEANTIDVKSSCGDVEIGTVNDAKVKNNYGNISIKNINNYMDIKEDCGDIEIENVNINKNSYIKNSLGNIEITHINDIHVDAKTDLGETSVKDNYKSDIILKIKNNCGDIEVNN